MLNSNSNSTDLHGVCQLRDDRKITNVFSIFKKQEKSDLGYNRSVNLTSIAFEISEQILKERIVKDIN